MRLEVDPVHLMVLDDKMNPPWGVPRVGRRIDPGSVFQQIVEYFAYCGFGHEGIWKGIVYKCC